MVVILLKLLIIENILTKETNNHEQPVGEYLFFIEKKE